MPRFTLVALLCAAALSARAEQEPNEYEKSLLFQDQSNPYEELNEGTTDTDDQDAYCDKLSQQIADSTLRLQKKTALTQRYNAECKTRNGPRERSSLKDSNRMLP